MSITDGFHLWIGKVLADLTIVGAIIAAAILVFAGLYVYLLGREWIKKLKERI
jgi:hypothetical protein